VTTFYWSDLSVQIHKTIKHIVVSCSSVPSKEGKQITWIQTLTKSTSS